MPPAARYSQTFRGHASTVTSVAFTSDGKHVVTASADTTAALWDVESGEKIRTFDEGHSSFLYGVALSGDDKLAVTGGYDSTAVLWDVASGKILKSFRGGPGRDPWRGPEPRRQARRGLGP